MPQFGSEGGKLVKMGGEQAATNVDLMKMLERCPGDGQPVEGRRAAADFIENDKRAGRGLVENACRLEHLDHEGRASAGQVVGRADPRKQLVDRAQMRLSGRNEGPHLREN